jgi:hypothetical protein
MSDVGMRRSFVLGLLASAVSTAPAPPAEPPNHSPLAEARYLSFRGTEVQLTPDYISACPVYIVHVYMFPFTHFSPTTSLRYNPAFPQASLERHRGYPSATDP